MFAIYLLPYSKTKNKKTYNIKLNEKNLRYLIYAIIKPKYL